MSRSRTCSEAHRDLSRTAAFAIPARALLFAIVLTVLSDAHAQTLLDARFDSESAALAPEGWQFAAARGACAGTWDREQAVSGSRSLRLSIPEDATARAHWRYIPKIPVEPGKAYRLSVRMLPVDVTGEAYVICYENGREAPDSWHIAPRLAGTQDWTEQTIEFRTRPDAEWLRLICKLRHGTGTVWFDDLRLVAIDSARVPVRRVRIVPADDGFPLQALWTPAQWTQHGVLHLVRAHVNPLSLFFWGKGAELRTPAIVVETTAGVSLLGPIVRGRGPMPESGVGAPETVTGGDPPRRRWRFPIPDEPLRRRLKPTPHWENYYHLYADVGRDCPEDGELRWRFENGGALGPEHRLPVVVAPGIPPPFIPASDFSIHTQHTGALRHPDPAVRARLVQFLRTAGIAGGLAMAFYEPHLDEVDQHYQDLGLELHTWRFDSYAGTAPDEHRLVGTKGEPSTSKVCPQSQLEHVQPWYGNLRDYYAKKLATGLDRLIIDYEPPVFDACFCERCRRAFALHSGLAVTECLEPPPHELQKRYAEQWGAFRAAQNGGIVRTHCEVIHSINPDVRVGLCSWRGDEASARRGADIREFEPYAAFHCPMVYTAGRTFHDLVRETCQRTRAPVLPFIEILDISQPRSLSPAELRMNLLATGFSGGGGAFMWVGMECLDARYMLVITGAARTIRDIREDVPFNRTPVEWLSVEPTSEKKRTITLNGRTVDLFADNPHLHVRTHLWGNDSAAAASALNYDTRAPHDVRVRLSGEPTGRYSVRFHAAKPGKSWAEQTLGKTALAEGIVLRVPPNGFAALTVKKHP